MKDLFKKLMLPAVLLSFLSCGGSGGNTSPEPEPEEPNYIHGVNAIVPPSASFAKDDGTPEPDGTPARKVAALLEKAGTDIVKGLYRVNITDAQYAEIKAFTDQLTDGLQQPEEIHGAVFRWIVDNIRYASGYVDNDPYPVFHTRQAICQGYANLLTVMLHTQGIPAFNANGMLDPVGGHAWNYVYLDEWYVSDPTNNGHFRMSAPDTYTHLIPMSLDVDLFETDDFIFHFNEAMLTLRQVKQAEKQLIVPFSVEGFQVEAFNPDTELPSTVEEIYLGKNIRSLGENLIGLSLHAPSVRRAYVESGNAWMESYGQVVYRQSLPYYVPASATVIQFRAIATVGKNLLTKHEGVETLVFQPGTKRLEAYAIEDCPQLQKAYVPEETVVDANAFYGVHPDFRLIRGVVKD